MPGLEVRGIGVRIRIFSLDITFSGLYGIRPVPVNPPWIFVFIIEVKNCNVTCETPP